MKFRGMKNSLAVTMAATMLATMSAYPLIAMAQSARGIMMYEDTKTGGLAGEIAALINEHVFEYLDGPVVRVTAPDTPVPYSPPLEDAFLPNAAKIAEKARWLARY